MERTTNKKPRWKKVGGGSMRLARGKIVKPNEVFSAYESELPKGCGHLLMAVDGQTQEEEEPTPASATPSFEPRSKGGGWYDVVNIVSGKPVNEKSLRAEQANELVKELS